MTAYMRLLNDIKSALSFFPDAADGYTPPPFRIVITLGSIMMPKSAMLFQIPAVQRDFAATRYSAAPTGLIANRSDSSGSLESDNELPPDSDSDREEPSEESGSPKVPTTPQPSTKTMPSTPPTRSPFTPFCDTDTVNSPIPSSQLASSVPASQSRLSPRPNILSTFPASPATPSLPPSNLHHVSDENQTSKLRLEKRFKAAERELTVGLSNLDLFTEETGKWLIFNPAGLTPFPLELSKIHVYLQAPRTYTGNGWHPRASAAKTLDSLTKFPNVDAPARTKLGKMNACAIRVTLTDGETTAAGSSHGLNDAEECIWLEWDGKLTGVE
jgi:hypothetical protein